MKRTALLALLITSLSMLAGAQATIPVSGQRVKMPSGLPLTGILRFTVTDTTNTPVTYTVSGGSPSTAAIDVSVLLGAVQNTGGFPPQIPNPATMSPSNTRYRIQVCSAACGTIYFTLPYTNITLANFSYDSYTVGSNITVSGLGLPILPCAPSALYTNTLASDPYPWVCSLLSDSGSVYWTQNPSLNPSCAAANLAVAVPIGGGPPFCLPSLAAFATPGLVFASPTGFPAGPVGLTPFSATGPVFQTNGTNNAAQTGYNLVAGTNVTLTNTSGTAVRVDVASGSGTPATPNLSIQFNNGGNFGAAPLSTDSSFQQLTYTGINAPINGSIENIHVNLPCAPNATPGMPAGQALGQSMCLQVLYVPTFPGWNNGDTSASGTGWMSERPLEVVGRIASAGIHSNLINLTCDGIGDCTLIDGFLVSRGAGGLDYAAEGQDGFRLSLQEGGETTGTVNTTGNNLTTLPVSQNENTDGVGLPIYNPTYDVISTTVSSKTVGATPDYGVMTVAATLPVSLQCSTVAAGNSPLGTLPIGTYVSKTLTLNTTADLSALGGVGQIAAFLEPTIQRARAISFGTFNGGAQTQTMSILLNQDVGTGSRYCLGGMSDRGIEQVVFTRNGQVYLVDSLGSPTNHTMWFSSPTAIGPAPPVGTGVSAINIFHVAQIVGVATPGVFNLSENNIHWNSTDGFGWISPNIVNQIRQDELIEDNWSDPYLDDQGHGWLKNGVSTKDSRFLFMKNETPVTNYFDHGGTYGAPSGIVFQGPIGGIIFDTAPESCHYAGNPCVAAAISMGPIAIGSSQTQWIIASNRASGDDSQIAFLPATNSWVFRTPGQGTSDPAGPGFMSTSYQFLAGAALVDPTHTIEASGSSNISTVGADTTAAILIENRNGTGSTHEDLFFGLEDSFNQRGTVGGLSMVNVSNSHFGPIGDLHVWLNNAGAATDWFQMYHDGGFASTGMSDQGAGSFNFASGYLNGIRLIAIANVAVVMPTTAVAANTCTTPATATMTGLATSSTISYDFASNPTAVTGWGSSGGLYFRAWPTANTLNWSVCNQTTSSITPGAITLNVGAK